MRDENPYKKYYFDYCVHCSNNGCKGAVYDEKFNYNRDQKKIIQNCADLKLIVDIIKG